MRLKLKRRGIPLGLLAIVFLFSGSAGVFVGTSSTRFCEMCHIMQPEVVTWQASAHDKVACATCHVESGFRNNLGHQMEIFRRIYLTVTKSYLLPVEIKYKVDNDVCLACHTFARTITPRNDIVVPHAEHINAGVNCMDCHEGIVHARTAQREVTIDGNFNRWTPQLGDEQMVPENLRINMNGCINCHKKRGGKLPTQCEGCHTRIIEPISHKDGRVWLITHGPQAVRDLTNCDSCHNYTNISRKPFSPQELDINVYPRTNSFCSDCHMRRPVTHSDTWAHAHSRVARSNAGLCMVCHSTNKPEPWEKSAETYCSKCHQSNLGSAFFQSGQ